MPAEYKRVSTSRTHNRSADTGGSAGCLSSWQGLFRPPVSALVLRKGYNVSLCVPSRMKVPRNLYLTMCMLSSCRRQWSCGYRRTTTTRPADERIAHSSRRGQGRCVVPKGPNVVVRRYPHLLCRGQHRLICVCPSGLEFRCRENCASVGNPLMWPHRPPTSLPSMGRRNLSSRQRQDGRLTSLAL